LQQRRVEVVVCYARRCSPFYAETLSRPDSTRLQELASPIRNRLRDLGVGNLPLVVEPCSEINPEPTGKVRRFVIEECDT
jgi:hypothetical protein